MLVVRRAPRLAIDRLFGEATVDHSRPKARFAELAYTWANHFRFERYFATGELAPAPTASSELRQAPLEDDRDLAYRYPIPISRAAI